MKFDPRVLAVLVLAACSSYPYYTLRQNSFYCTVSEIGDGVYATAGHCAFLLDDVSVIASGEGTGFAGDFVVFGEGDPSAVKCTLSGSAYLYGRKVSLKLVGDLLYVDFEPFAGDSGAALYAADGSFVGLIVGKTSDGRGIAVPAFRICGAIGSSPY